MIKTADCKQAIVDWAKSNPNLIGSLFNPPLRHEKGLLTKKNWTRIDKKQTKNNGVKLNQRTFECVVFDDLFNGGIITIYTYDDGKTILEIKIKGAVR